MTRRVDDEGTTPSSFRLVHLPVYAEAHVVDTEDTAAEQVAQVIAVTT